MGAGQADRGMYDDNGEICTLSTEVATLKKRMRELERQVEELRKKL